MKTLRKATRRVGRRAPRTLLNTADQQHVDDLLQSSADAEDPQTALEYAQQAADLYPDDPAVQSNVQEVVFKRLSKDAYVAFVADTEKHYVVSFRNSRPVMIPKSRVRPEAFPDADRTDGERALHMVGWVLLGLIPAGLGAMLLSPLMASRALHVLIHDKDDARERRRAWVAIALAGVLGCLGMVFSLVLAIHMVR